MEISPHFHPCYRGQNPLTLSPFKNSLSQRQQSNSLICRIIKTYAGNGARLRYISHCWSTAAAPSTCRITGWLTRAQQLSALLSRQLRAEAKGSDKEKKESSCRHLSVPGCNSGPSYCSCHLALLILTLFVHPGRKSETCLTATFAAHFPKKHWGQTQFQAWILIFCSGS